MAQKEVAESHNQTDVRYIRRHPKHDRFPVRRLGFPWVGVVRIADAFGNCADTNVAEIINVRASSRRSADRRRVSSGMGITRLAPVPRCHFLGFSTWTGKISGPGASSRSMDSQEAGCHAPSKRTPQREENQPIGWAWNMGELLLIGPNLVRASRNVRTIAGRGDVVVPLVGSSDRLPIGFLIP